MIHSKSASIQFLLEFHWNLIMTTHFLHDWKIIFKTTNSGLNFNDWKNPLDGSRVWLRYSSVWLRHAKCDFHPGSVVSTRTSVISKRKSVILTRISQVWRRTDGYGGNYPLLQEKKNEKRLATRTPECNFKTHKECFLHAKCNFHLHAEKYFHTQSLILHTECDFTRRVWFYTQNMASTRTRVSLSVISTRSSVLSTRLSVIYKRSSVISTRSVILKSKNEISTRTRLISTRTRLISTRRVWLLSRRE
jgi:hypothetical protein